MVTQAGWRRIGPDPAIARWAGAALSLAKARLAASSEPWRCGGTWFVGVDALPNAQDGTVDGVPLPWDVLGLRSEPLHKAQLSVIRAGYPQPSPEESEAAFRFRRDRDAAHLDGLLAMGPAKRRMLREPHGWVLGLPLNETSPDAAPLTVWEGSHKIIHDALTKALLPFPPETWGEVDLTDAYQSARREVFKTCRRILLPVRPGEATLLHRMTIHGVAAWPESASSPPEGRIIAYFRPLLASVEEWIARP